MFALRGEQPVSRESVRVTVTDVFCAPPFGKPDLLEGWKTYSADCFRWRKCEPVSGTELYPAILRPAARKAKGKGSGSAVLSDGDDLDKAAARVSSEEKRMNALRRCA